MTTTKNNEHKKLNFSSEREQNQACLNSAEHEKNQGRKVLNVPNLRFPEFQGEWTTSLLSDYLTENKERNKKGEFDKTDVLSVSGDYGIVNQIELLGRSFAGASVLPYHVVRHGNIVYTKSPLKEYPYGIVKANTGVDGIVSTLYAVYNIKNNVDAQFIEYYFSLANRTNRYFKPIVRIGAKHDMKIGNQEVLANKVTFPNLEEQTKIASLFRFLDERIATQNKIIDKLQSLIKGIAQKIVHSNKTNVRLSECVECSSSTLQESDVCEHGAYPVYGANGIVGYLDNYNTEGEAVYIIKDGSGVGTVSYVTGKCSATGTLNTLQAKEGYSLQYLYYLLKVFNFEPYKTGMAIPHIYFKDYGKAKFFCPSYTEQLQYAQSLSAIDSKLLVEKNILTSLSMQKKYLLRQMFI